MLWIMQVCGGMDAGTKPTGTYLWRPAKFRAYTQVRFRDLWCFSFRSSFTLRRIFSSYYLYLTDIKCSDILSVLFCQ